MSKFDDIHLELEIKAKDFREKPTEENGNLIIQEIVKLINEDASIMIDGIPSDVNPTITVPSGYYAPDGRFYIHIFSSKVSFEVSTAEHPMMSHMKALYGFMEENSQIGGFSLNHTKDTGAILITREDLEPYLKKMKS